MRLNRINVPVVDARALGLRQFAADGSYREKTFWLDNAIDENAGGTGQNPANAHLRRQCWRCIRKSRKRCKRDSGDKEMTTEISGAVVYAGKSLEPIVIGA